MLYVRNNARSGYIRLGMAVVSVFYFASTNYSLATDWSCTQPPNRIIKDAVDKYPGQNYNISNDNHIIRYVEDSLAKRRGFKSKIISCEGSSCQISKEFIGFIGKMIELPATKVPMSICSRHSSGCTADHCSAEYKESYDVIYSWDYGKMIFTLEISKKNTNHFNIDEVLEDNLAYDPKIQGNYGRFVGVRRDARLFIGITALNH